AGRSGEEPFRQDDRGNQYRCGWAHGPVRRVVVRAALQACRRARHCHAHGSGGRGPGPGGDRGHGERRGTRERSARSGRARRRALLAAAPVGRVPRAAQVRHRRRQELRRPGRRHDRGGLVPARVRGRLPLGAPRHRGHGLHRRRGPPPGQGPDGSRGPALHRIHSQARGRVTRGLRGAAVLLALVGAGGGGAAPAAAQVDTTARDTTARKDTTARDTTPAYPPVFLDPARISLAPLERVDVIVLPATLRVYLVTRRQRSTATASEVGVATGQVRTANYRGAFLQRWRSGVGLSLVADYNNNDGFGN